MTNKDVAIEILRRKSEAISPNKMYEVARELGLDSKLTYSSKTPWLSFSSYIYTDLKTNPDTPFEIVQVKPIKIKLKNQTIKEPKERIKEKEPKEPSYSERDLHPLLTSFIFSNDNFKAYSKTIYHENSTKSSKGVDKWLYPDIVGVSFEYADFRSELRGFIGKFSTLPVKIYAFELKKYLCVGNFRECYFQAVSNSSFANEGYLVALDIDESDEELMDLIKRLSSSFGIGVISLDSQEVAESKILAKAKFRQSLDYLIMSELSSKNQNFKDFLVSVAAFDSEYSHRFKGDFDEILDDERLEAHLLKNRIKTKE